MERNRMVLVIGEAEEAEAIRCALEASGIFAVVCGDAEAAVVDGMAADLEIVCYSPSRFWHPAFQGATHGTPLDPSGRLEKIARMARIARHPLPVIFVHEAPTIWDVNYLRSCGSFFVLDRRLEETNGWTGLRDTVERALRGELQCAFCQRKLERDARALCGAGQFSVCQECLLLSARDLLWAPGPGSQLSQ